MNKLQLAFNAAIAMAVLVSHTGDAAPGSRAVRIPATDYVVYVDSQDHPRSSPPSPALVKAIAQWIAGETGLREPSMYPSVALESPRRIAVFRYTGLLSDKAEDRAAVPAGAREVVAAYDPLTATIYLPKGWSASDPVHLSVLVHEMVHHFQARGNVQYACPEATEALAYTAQDKWLALFGRDLARDFEIDTFTLFVSTQCMR